LVIRTSAAKLTFRGEQSKDVALGELLDTLYYADHVLEVNYGDPILSSDIVCGRNDVQP